jgi:putative hemolysin
MRPHTTTARYTVGLAQDPDEVRAAQRLRWHVFADELGARISSAEAGVDRDRWDAHAEHLVVRETTTGDVVGTYRLLTAAGARRAGGFYAESEFWLAGLLGLGGGLAEIGRACVHPDHRNGVVVGLLWSGVLGWLDDRACDHVIGCASIRLDAGLVPVRRLCRRLLHDHGAPMDLRAEPRRRLPRAADDAGVPGDVEAPEPPLLRGYLRLGALVCGEPAWDADFRTADLLVVLPLARLSRRHATRLRRAA